jgi:hypothetical protein
MAKEKPNPKPKPQVKWVNLYPPPVTIRPPRGKKRT